VSRYKQVFPCAEELQVAIFHGESEVYRRHPLSSTAPACWFPQQRRYRKTFLYVLFFWKRFVTSKPDLQREREREGEIERERERALIMDGCC
jgi:hypothetical protein